MGAWEAIQLLNRKLECFKELNYTPYLLANINHVYNDWKAKYWDPIDVKEIDGAPVLELSLDSGLVNGEVRLSVDIKVAPVWPAEHIDVQFSVENENNSFAKKATISSS
jgi:hypothetical protein